MTLTTDAGGDPHPELVLLNAKAITMDARASIHEAVAIRGGLIVAVGSNDDIRELAVSSTRTVDVGGRTMIPGLIDSHIHGLRAGRHWDIELHWEHVRSLQEGFESISRRAREQPPNTWILIVGGWHLQGLRERRLPSSEELSAIAPNHPVWLQHLYDRALLNRAAVEALGLRQDMATRRCMPIRREARGLPSMKRHWGASSPASLLISWFSPTTIRASPMRRYGICIHC